MPLYLDEISFSVANKGDLKKAYDLISGAVKNGFPPGVMLKAGPWFSNEECKVMLILDIQDHALTFAPFSAAMASGVVSKRRLSQIVDWDVAEKAINA